MNSPEIYYIPSQSVKEAQGDYIFPDTAYPLLGLLKKLNLTMSHCLELHFTVTNIYCLSRKRQFWKNYTSGGEHVSSRVLGWRFGGTILSGSFFITQGEASAKGRRTVILETPGLKADFSKSQFKSKNYGQVSQTSRKTYSPKCKKLLPSCSKSPCENVILVATDNIGSQRWLQNTWISSDTLTL